ncbi:MAG TPA: metallophosphoesterase [Longimicrobiales bacterium]|nr:metallophosphoesterase [Longimicrobiales bacterium]
MLKLLHVSDLHFGPAYLPRVGAALLRAAEALAPDIIVASGDFTQRAKRVQYAEARAFLERLPPVPRIVVPGNHDVPLYRVAERLFKPYALYREYISRDLDTVLVREDVVIVALNTTTPYRAIVNGRIRREQLELCARVFRDAPSGAARIVVAHHHFAPAPDYEGGKVLPGAKGALDRFADLGVELILGGHLHRAYIGNSLDVYPGRERDHGIIIVQAGTATSRRGRAREREKNSFNVIVLDDATIRVTHYMYFEESDAFEPLSRHVFPRAGRRYLAAPGEAGCGGIEGSDLRPFAGRPIGKGD